MGLSPQASVRPSGGRYHLVTLDMGFTLVDLHSGLDKQLLAIAHQGGYTAVTLVDVRAAMRSFWDEWSQADAVRTWQPSLAADRALSLEMDRQICTRLGITDMDVVLEVNRRSHELFNDPQTYTVFPEVFEALALLRAAVPRLGILSNWGWYLPELCERLGLAEYFDFIVTSARVGATKPNAAIFHEALKRGRSSPERMLHVGDSLSADVQGAQALGITGVLVDRRGMVQPNNHPVVSDLREVLDLL